MNGSLRMCIVIEFLRTHAETETCHLPFESESGSAYLYSD